MSALRDLILVPVERVCRAAQECRLRLARSARVAHKSIGGKMRSGICLLARSGIIDGIQRVAGLRVDSAECGVAGGAAR